MARSALNPSSGAGIQGSSRRTTSRTTPISKLLANLFPAAFIEMASRRLVEIIGGGLILLALALVVSLLSYHHAGPSLNSAALGPTKNILGIIGAYSADIMLQIFGAAAFLLGLEPPGVFSKVNYPRMLGKFLPTWRVLPIWMMRFRMMMRMRLI